MITHPRIGASKSLVTRLFRKNRGASMPAPSEGRLASATQGLSGALDVPSSSVSVSESAKKVEDSDFSDSNFTVASESLGLAVDTLSIVKVAYDLSTKENISGEDKVDAGVEITKSLSGLSGKTVNIIGAAKNLENLSQASTYLGGATAIASGLYDLGKAGQAGLKAYKAAHKQNKHRLGAEATGDILLAVGKVAAGIVMVAMVASPIGPIVLGAVALTSVGFSIFKHRSKAKKKDEANEIISGIEVDQANYISRKESLGITTNKVLNKISTLKEIEENLTLRNSKRAIEVTTVIEGVEKSFSKMIKLKINGVRKSEEFNTLLTKIKIELENYRSFHPGNEFRLDVVSLLDEIEKKREKLSTP